jgi:hypothetical protein
MAPCAAPLRRPATTGETSTDFLFPEIELGSPPPPSEPLQHEVVQDPPINRKSSRHDAFDRSARQGQVQSPQAISERQRKTGGRLRVSSTPRTRFQHLAFVWAVANQASVPILDTLDSVRPAPSRTLAIDAHSLTDVVQIPERSVPSRRLHRVCRPPPFTVPACELDSN